VTIIVMTRCSTLNYGFWTIAAHRTLTQLCRLQQLTAPNTTLSGSPGSPNQTQARILTRKHVCFVNPAARAAFKPNGLLSLLWLTGQMTHVTRSLARFRKLFGPIFGRVSKLGTAHARPALTEAAKFA
jgi:hypothetical protein